MLMPNRIRHDRSPARALAVRSAVALALIPALFGAPLTGYSQTGGDGGDAATIAALREQVAALTRRLEEVERRQAAQTAAKPDASAERLLSSSILEEVRVAQTAAKEAQAAAAEVKAAQRSIQSAPVSGPVITAGTVQGLLPPEEMGSTSSGDDALRSDLPGIALRIPNTDTEVRVYGFAKMTAWSDFEARNQSDAPAVQTIPLDGSGADQQGGDFGMTSRFSRFGIDTRSLTEWGTLETRLEGDFGGGVATSNNAVFRLRQAWGELGTEQFRVLIGQANSLWNEGLFETLIDSTNLNQSFVRQAQLRLTGRLAPGLTGQLSAEAPETSYTSARGVVNPGSEIDGGASPAFNTMPDFLGRLTYRQNGLELGGRALVRNLTVRTDGTAVSPSGSDDVLGWGLAGHVRFPMRWVAEGFGADELLAMAYVGEGLGRYFAGNTSGQDALSNLDLPEGANDFSLDAVESAGVTVAYRRFWTPQLRSNFAFSYARQDFPDYAGDFAPGSAAANALNREMEQIFINLIWSPFGKVKDGVFSSGWLDLGLEYLYSHREVLGGAAATGGAGDGEGTASRVLFGGVVRF
jgi:hypothetical protein